MSSPKLYKIIDAIAKRLEVIFQEDGFYTNMGLSVIRTQRAPQADEMPCCIVYLGERSAESQQCDRTRCTMLINVIGYAERLPDAEQLGMQIMADIQRAVELEDTTLGGLLRGQFGLGFESEEIFVPEVGANVVGARVTYSAPNVRIYGDPEIS